MLLFLPLKMLEPKFFLRHAQDFCIIKAAVMDLYDCHQAFNLLTDSLRGVIVTNGNVPIITTRSIQDGTPEILSSINTFFAGSAQRPTLSAVIGRTAQIIKLASTRYFKMN